MVQGVQTLEVRDDEDGMRLDRWIKLKFPDMPHSRLQKAMRKGELRIDGGREVPVAGARVHLSCGAEHLHYFGADGKRLPD